MTQVSSLPDRRQCQKTGKNDTFATIQTQKMADEKKEEQPLHGLFEQITHHLETRWEYLSLTTTEKMALLASGVAGAVVVFVFAVLVLFFFSMGFGWWLGDFIGNRAGGFALAGLVFVPAGALVYFWIRPFVREKVIESLFHEKEAEKNADHE